MKLSSLVLFVIAAIITAGFAMCAQPLPVAPKKALVAGHAADAVPLPPKGVVFRESLLPCGSPDGRWWKVGQRTVAVTMFECGAFRFAAGNKGHLAAYKVVDSHGRIVQSATVAALPPDAQMGNGDRLEPLPMGFVVRATVPRPGRYSVWAIYDDEPPQCADWLQSSGGCYRGVFTD